MNTRFWKHDPSLFKDGAAGITCSNQDLRSILTNKDLTPTSGGGLKFEKSANFIGGIYIIKVTKTSSRARPLVALQGEAFWGLLKNGKPFLTYILMLSEFWKTHLDRIGMKLTYLHFESKVK